MTARAVAGRRTASAITAGTRKSAATARPADGGARAGGREVTARDARPGGGSVEAQAGRVGRREAVPTATTRHRASVDGSVAALTRAGAAAAGSPGGESALGAEMNGRAAAGAAGGAGCAARSSLSDRDHIDASSLGFHQDALPASLAATRPGAAINPRTATTARAPDLDDHPCHAGRDCKRSAGGE